MRIVGGIGGRSIPPYQYVATVEESPNVFDVWKWQQDSVGWGTRYATQTTYGLGRRGESVKFSPDNNYIAIGFTAVELVAQIAVFPWSFNGVGTVIAGTLSFSATLPNYYQTRCVAWHPNQDAIVYGLRGSTTLGATSWSGSSWGTAYSAPASAPTGSVNTTMFSPDGNYVFASSESSPYIIAWNWSSSTGFGSKISDPASLPATDVRSIDVISGQVAIANANTPFIEAYPFTSSWGTKYSDPGQLPASSNDISFSSNGSVAVATSITPYITAYPFSSGFGTKYSDPVAVSGSIQATGVDFAPDNKNIVLGGLNGSPYMAMYAWSAGFGTQYADPVTLPTAAGQGKTRFSN